MLCRDTAGMCWVLVRCPSWGLLEGRGFGGPRGGQMSPVPQKQWCVGQDGEELGMCLSPVACMAPWAVSIAPGGVSYCPGISFTGPG